MLLTNIKKNILFNILLTLSNVLIPIITFPFVSKTIGPEGVGRVQFAQTFIQYFSFLAALGIPIYGIRLIAKSKNLINKRKVIFSNLVFINVFFSLILLICYATIVFSSSFLYADFQFYLIGSITILLSFSNVDWYFSGLEKFKLIAFRSIISKLISTILVFLFVKNQSDDLLYFFLITCAALVNNIYNIYSLRKEFSFFLVNYNEIIKYIRPLLLIFLTVVAASIYSTLDVLILGRIKGYVELGYYSAASKINKMVIPLLTAISAALLPKLSFDIENNNHLESKKLIQKSLDVSILLGIPIVIGIAILAPELVIVIAGYDFIPSVQSVQIMSPVILIIAISTICSVQVLIPFSRDLQNAISVLIGLILSLILNFILVPLYGHIGATISNVSSELVVMAMFSFYASRYIKLNFKWKDIITTIIICLFFIVIIEFIRQFVSNNLVIIMFSVLFCGLWFFFIHFFVTKNEIIRKEITNLLKLR
ncbi:MAG: hypothetical protein RL259_89 [Bacteroidota bacterium]|jgi:O-antigen/teichoic acid export membrane protein